jgi:hypothetical protein
LITGVFLLWARDWSILFVSVGRLESWHWGRPCRGFVPRSPAYQSAALTTRSNPRPNVNLIYGCFFLLIENIQACKCTLILVLSSVL